MMNVLQKFLVLLTILLLAGTYTVSANEQNSADISFLNVNVSVIKIKDFRSADKFSFYTLPSSSDSQNSNSKYTTIPFEYEEEDEDESFKHKKTSDTTGYTSVNLLDHSDEYFLSNSFQGLLLSKHSKYQSPSKKYILIEVFRL